MVVMVVGKGNGGYRIYNWESETLEQLGNQVKLTLVGNTSEGTHLELKCSVCMVLDVFGPVQLTLNVLGTVASTRNTKEQMVPAFHTLTLWHGAVC